MQASLIVSSLILSITISRTIGAAIITQPIEYVVSENGLQMRPIDYMDSTRIKRSGSGDILGYVKSGIQTKLSQFAKASAGAISHFSKHSSGGGYSYGIPSVSKTLLFWKVNHLLYLFNKSKIFFLIYFLKCI